MNTEQMGRLMSSAGLFRFRYRQMAGAAPSMNGYFARARTACRIIGGLWRVSALPTTAELDIRRVRSGAIGSAPSILASTMSLSGIGASVNTDYLLVLAASPAALILLPGDWLALYTGDTVTSTAGYQVDVLAEPLA